MHTLSPTIVYTKQGFVLFGLTAIGQYGNANLLILIAHNLRGQALSVYLGIGL